jgi:DNA-binding beta-propeller fold protein YncE
VATGLSVPLPTDAEAYREYLRASFRRWQESQGALRERPPSPIYEAVGEPPEFWVIDGPTGAVTARASLSIRNHRRYFGPAVTPDGRRSYLSVWGPTGRLIPIDNARRAVLEVPEGGIPVGEGPVRMAFSPDGKRGYVATAEGVVVVDTDIASPTYNRVLPVPEGRSIRAQTRPFGIVVSDDGKRAYVSNQRSDSVSVIDTDPASPRFHTALPVPDGLGIRVGGMPRDLALDPVRPRLYVANERGPGVSVIDLDSRRGSLHTVLATVSLAGAPPPYGVTVSADGGRIYVPCSAGGLAVVDPVSLTVATRIPTGGGIKFALSESGLRGFLLWPAGVMVVDTDPTSATLHSVVATLPARVE